MKKISLIVVIAVLIIVAIILVVTYRGNQNQTGTGNVPQATSINKIENLAHDKIPLGLPKGLPIESSTKVITNYTATTPDGRVQSTRSFVSGKSVSDNTTLYNDFLTKNKWRILDDRDVSSGKVFLAQDPKTSNLLTISVRSQTDNSSSIVDLTFLANP